MSSPSLARSTGETPSRRAQTATFAAAPPGMTSTVPKTSEPRTRSCSGRMKMSHATSPMTTIRTRCSPVPSSDGLLDERGLELHRHGRERFGHRAAGLGLVGVLEGRGFVAVGYDGLGLEFDQRA